MGRIEKNIEAFLAGQIEALQLMPIGERGGWSGHGTILPGAFAPLHSGHVGMWRAAQRLSGLPVAFELSVTNVDKSELNAAQLSQRARQFDSDMRLWVTRGATFVQKSVLFPGATFVVGTDTITRIADPKYYGGQASLRNDAIESIARAGCRFLVAGRSFGDVFQQLDDLKLPNALRCLSSPIPESEFREDVSSSVLRDTDA